MKKRPTRIQLSLTPRFPLKAAELLSNREETMLSFFFDYKKPKSETEEENDQPRNPVVEYLNNL